MFLPKTPQQNQHLLDPTTCVPTATICSVLRNFQLMCILEMDSNNLAFVTEQKSTYQEMSMIDLSNSSWMTTKGRFRHVSLKQRKQHSEMWRFYVTTHITPLTPSRSLTLFTGQALAKRQLCAWRYITSTSLSIPALAQNSRGGEELRLNPALLLETQTEFLNAHCLYAAVTEHALPPKKPFHRGWRQLLL